MRYTLFFLAFSLWQPAAICADEYIEEELGFRFKIPEGFREQTELEPQQQRTGAAVTRKLFVEDKETDGYVIIICLQRLGQMVNPFETVDPSQLPRQDELEFQLEKRRWQTIDLPVIRQDATIDGKSEFVGYLIQFPLKDEAIQLRVQGPKSRERDVLETFNKSVESFVNTKTYVVRVEPISSRQNLDKVPKWLVPLIVIVEMSRSWNGYWLAAALAALTLAVIAVVVLFRRRMRQPTTK